MTKPIINKYLVLMVIPLLLAFSCGPKLLEGDRVTIKCGKGVFADGEKLKVKIYEKADVRSNVVVETCSVEALVLSAKKKWAKVQLLDSRKFVGYVKTEHLLLKKSSNMRSGGSTAEVQVMKTPPAIKTPSDRDKIIGVFENLKKAIMVSDINAYMDNFSIFYEDLNAKEMETIKKWKFYSFKKIKFFLNHIDFNGNQANASVEWLYSAVVVSTGEISSGSVFNKVVLEKEDGVWKIISLKTLK